MMPKSDGMFYRQAYRSDPFAGRARSHRGLRSMPFAGRARSHRELRSMPFAGRARSHRGLRSMPFAGRARSHRGLRSMPFAGRGLGRPPRSHRGWRCGSGLCPRRARRRVPAAPRSPIRPCDKVPVLRQQ